MNFENRINSLPSETVNIILEYQGFHVFRNGRFMQRMAKTDQRYAVLKTRPAISTESYNANFEKTIENRLYVFDISIIIENENIHWFMFAKEKYPEKGMIGENWGVCKQKCISYRLD